MSNNFKTHMDALLYINKYGIKHPFIIDAYDIAEALLRAYKDGAKEPIAAPDAEGQCENHNWWNTNREFNFCPDCGRKFPHQ